MHSNRGCQLRASWTTLRSLSGYCTGFARFSGVKGGVSGRPRRASGGRQVPRLRAAPGRRADSHPSHTGSACRPDRVGWTGRRLDRTSSPIESQSLAVVRSFQIMTLSASEAASASPGSRHFPVGYELDTRSDREPIRWCLNRIVPTAATRCCPHSWGLTRRGWRPKSWY